MEKSIADRQPNFIKAWILASRPKTLSASMLPVLIATGLAKSIVNQTSFLISLLAFLTTLFIQIGTNLINDALDFRRGADTGSRLGPMRVTQAGLLPMKQVLMGGFLCFTFAFLVAIPLILQGGWPILMILLFSCLIGYLYTGGPFPLAYYGLGELSCFLFFGLINTATVFYLQTGFLDGRVWLAGTQIGLLTNALMAINNLRDIEGDAKSHKRTLAVRFGKQFARWEIAFLALGPFVIGLLWMLWDYDFAAWLPFLILPFVYRYVYVIWISEPSYRYNYFLAYSSLSQFLFSILLFIGYQLN
jgi:1,4-dihydroxy-2-naphthoate octaprenyltransferase